jgi:aminoglycoside phosphotransferase (APT) family kinase protein
VPEDKREITAFSFIDVLAELHSVDPDNVGLGELGKRDSYVARQLKTWYRSWTSSVAEAEYDDPRAHELQSFFLDNIPDQGPARVVHGDYGLHNVLIGPDHKIAAVVDWEISTLGDPLADLAYALNWWGDPEDEEPLLPEASAAVPGFPSRSELATRYAQSTGRDLAMLDYYIGFNRWKTAAVVQGVYARYLAGKKSTEGVDLEALSQRITRSLDQSERAVNRLKASG